MKWDSNIDRIPLLLFIILSNKFGILLASGDCMSNICNELREMIYRKYKAKKYWTDISGIISATNSDGTISRWSIHKFHEAVEFKGITLNVMIIVKRVYGSCGELLYVKDLYAEQWI